MTFPEGPRLKQFIRAHDGGRTMTSIADDVGVTKQAVQAWCSGINEPTLSHLRLLARTLGVPLAEIVAALETTWTP